MILKSTGLDSRFQGTDSRDIAQNVSNLAGSVWKTVFRHYFGYMLGLSEYCFFHLKGVEPHLGVPVGIVPDHL